jgi:hypothetical protein
MEHQVDHSFSSNPEVLNRFELTSCLGLCQHLCPNSHTMHPKNFEVCGCANTSSSDHLMAAITCDLPLTT